MVVNNHQMTISSVCVCKLKVNIKTTAALYKLLPGSTSFRQVRMDSFLVIPNQLSNVILLQEASTKVA